MIKYKTGSVNSCQFFDHFNEIVHSGLSFHPTTIVYL